MKTLGQLAETFKEAMRIWDAQKAEGLSRLERLVVLEKTLRAAWPFTREWKFLCPRCDDTGLVMAGCPGDAACGRVKPHLPHDYGTPCWCQKGARFKPKQATETDHLAAIGKTVKPTRVGR